MVVHQANKKGNVERLWEREQTAQSAAGTTTTEDDFSFETTEKSMSSIPLVKTAKPLKIINLYDFKQTHEDKTQSHFGTASNHSLEKTPAASESATAISTDQQVKTVGVTEICRTEQKPVCNQEQFDKIHGFRRVNLSIMRLIIYKITVIRTWRGLEYFHFLESRIPIISWIRSYSWKTNILSDVLGGLMVSLMTIPQSLAYGYLVGIPPIHGLYSNMIAPLIYAFLGTSKHVAPGAFAIISLMVGALVEQLAGESNNSDGSGIGNPTNETARLCCSELSAETDTSKAINIAAEATFLVGIIQILLGILNAGVLAVWLSDHLVQGLTSGAAFHVFTSQLKTMTGVEGLPRTSDAMGVPKFYVCFFNNIKTIKLAPTLASVVCIICLLFSKEIVDPVFKKWSKIKFPMELFVVVFSILLCWLSDGTQYDLGLDIVGDVKGGFPAFIVPTVGKNSMKMMADVFSISIVCFVIHIALAKLIAKKLNYQIDANQEWLALGAMNLGSSFFQSFAGGASLSRTMTQVKLDTKSQLSTIVCVIVLCVVVGFASEYLRYLPKAVLAAIVVVALKDLFKQIGQARILFRQSIVDYLIWMVTFAAVVLVNVNIGLAIGVGFALLTVVFRSQWAESTCLGRIPTTSDYKGLGHYRSAEEVPGIKIFRFDAPLYFANSELFLHRLHCATGLDPLIVVEKLEESNAKVCKKKEEQKSTAEREGKALLPHDDDKPEIQLTVRRRHVKSNRSEIEHDGKAEEPHSDVDLVQLTHIIIDCSSFPYVDLMGIDALAQAHAEYTSINLTVFFCYCKVALRQLFETSDFYKRVPKSHVFVSIADAVTQAQNEQQAKWNQSSGAAVSGSKEERPAQPQAPSVLRL
uniref:STAS domain-containing protein n=1 Tax=Steinernema glaseri TaxID=37863 RepID=A0A1I7YNY3_9BILA